MNKIKIYIRTDLRTSSGKKVPNGKMASQSAHALMSLFLSLFDKKEDMLSLLPENRVFYDKLKSGEIEIEYIPLKKLEDLTFSLNDENVFPIIDQGRTAFNEPTLTTIAVAPENLKHIKFADCTAGTGERYASKQVIVINKEEIKDKWEMCSVVSEASLNPLLDFCIELNDSVLIPLNHLGLKNWIEGAFAKITVQPKEKDLLLLMTELNNQSQNTTLLHSVLIKDDVMKAISVGPDLVEKVDIFTKEGFKLA